MKKTLAMILAAVMALSLAACAPAKTTPAPTAAATQTPAPAAPEVAAYTAGTYEGIGTGMGGEVHVSVTFDSNAITAIEVGENAETALLSEPALTRLPQDIVNHQTLNVDMVSGATITSAAVLSAVASAVEQAGGNVEALKAAPAPAKEQGKDETVDVDVLVVGGGIAGMTAAYHASEAGLTVLLLEKLESMGGSSARSAGAVCYATEEGDPAGYFSAEQFGDWLVEMGRGQVNEALVRKIADMSAENVQIMRTVGFDPAYEMGEALKGGVTSRITNPLSDTEFIMAGGGMLTQAFYDNLAAKDNVTIMTRTRAETLLTDGDGSVVGATAARDNGGKVTVNAKAVILATGGFDQSDEYCDLVAPGLKDAENYSCIGNEGDGITMTQEVGAKVILDAPCPMGGGYVPYAALPSNASLIVDKNGKRFVNEAAEDVFLQAGIAKNDTGVSYYLCDSEAEDAAVLEEAVAAGTALKGDTIEALAAAIGANPATLQATVDRYNELKGKEDADFGKDAEKMTGIGEGPYYAVKMAYLVLTSYAGPVVDENCRVLTEAGEAIPGLYAAGERAACNITAYDTIGHGMSLQYCMSTGRIAATDAAEALK